MEAEGQVGRLSERAAEGMYMKEGQMRGEDRSIVSYPKCLGPETIWLSEAAAFR